MSITGNDGIININDADLHLTAAGSHLVFSDGSIMNTSPPNSDTTNTAYFSNGINAFIITETTANTGFAGNTAPMDAISVSSNLFISYTGNLTTYGQITAGSVANVESNILSLESDLSDNSSRIEALEASNVDIWSNLASNVSRIEALEASNVDIWSNLASNVSRIEALEASNVDIWSNLASNVSRIENLEDKTTDITWSGDVTTIANDLTVGGDLTVTGNVITSNNIQTNDPFFMIASNAPTDVTNSGYMFGRTGSNVMISHYPNSGNFGNVVISYTTSGANTATADIDFDNDLSLYVQGSITANTFFTDGTLSNLSANIVTLESDLSDNSSRINSLETKTTDITWSGGVTTIANDLTVGGYVETNYMRLEGKTSSEAYNCTIDFAVPANSSTGDFDARLIFNQVSNPTPADQDFRILLSTDGDGTAPSQPNMKFTRDGKVGICTDSPSANLHVEGNCHIFQDYTIGTSNTTSLNPQLRIGNDTYIQGNVYVGYSGRGNTGIINAATYWAGTGGLYGTQGYFGIAVNNQSISAGDPYGITEGEVISQTHFAITDGGNVGISNLSPGHNLSVEGDVYASNAYLPFTGAHISLNTLSSYEDGTLVASTGNVYSDDTVYNTSVEIEPTSVSKDKRVIGVTNNREISIFDKESNTYTTIIETRIIALGEGRMLVCNENGDIENGDYICSSNVIGHGMKQDDDLLHNYTVAKATENCSFTGPDDKKLVSVTFHCG